MLPLWFYLHFICTVALFIFLYCGPFSMLCIYIFDTCLLLHYSTCPLQLEHENSPGPQNMCVNLTWWKVTSSQGAKPETFLQKKNVFIVSIASVRDIVMKRDGTAVFKRKLVSAAVFNIQEPLCNSTFYAGKTGEDDFQQQNYIMKCRGIQAFIFAWRNIPCFSGHQAW